MILILHVLAAVIGIVSSTVRNVIFFRQGIINQNLQRVIWGSLVILGMTGFSLLLVRPALLHEPAFLLKMFFVGALLVSELYLTQKRSTLAILTSFFTWFFSFFWSGLERFGVGYLGVLGFYFGIVFLLVVISKIKNEFSSAT